MTVALTTSSAEWSENGSAGPYTFNFKFLANSDLSVYRVSLADVEALLVENVDYELTGAGAENGGSITLLDPQNNGGTIRAERNTSILQSTQFANQGAFYPAIHERSFDRLSMGALDNRRHIAAIETRGYTVQLNQVSAGTVVTTAIDTSLGDVIVQLPASGVIKVIKDGDDANTISFETTVEGQTVGAYLLTVDSEFIELTLIGTAWKATG